MLMIIGSFDIIVGIDWLSSHHVQNLCFKKAVRLHLPNRESLIVYGYKPNKNLRIISYLKARKYVYKKCCTFKDHIIDKRSKGRKIKDVP